ncbi:tape measure protein [Bifidobacterium pseudocatenulatum]|uniref:tape measure protein n=1 Tax=Bifidobacterium pseudocatenulatum TaxID=28026 RepID=UPI001F0FD69E|nr:tape measure protein [Bifidobacterium pseudocatenulatum]MCH4841358.1 tape measure protein [Bifidobacterium pseudocatenulatum]
MAHSAIMSVRITGNADDAVKAFEKTTTKAAAFGSAIGGLAVKGVTALWDTVKGFAGDVVNMSDSTDKFMNTMSFAGIDTANVEKASKAARDYADRTVYDLSTIQNTTAQLAANGIKDYTGLTEAAGNLNAVAGGNADTFGSVAMVLTQTAGAGKLTTENWNQLADAIPGASGKLQEALLKNGAFTGNFRDAMAKGEITADEFNQALMDLGMTDVAKQAATSTSTIEGAMGNLEAAVTGGLTDAFNLFKPAVTGGINAAATAVTNLAQTGTQGLQTFFTQVKDTGAFTALQTAAQSVGGGLQSLWDGIMNVVNAMTGGQPAGVAFGNMLNAVATAAQTVGGWLKTAGNWISQNLDLVTPLVAAVGGAVAVVTAVTTAMQLAAAAQALLNAVMAANPIMLVITLIAALVAGLTYFFTCTNTGKAVWSSFTNFIAGCVSGILGWFSGLGSSIGGAFNNAANSAKNTWNGVVSWFRGIPGTIGGFFSGAGTLLYNAGASIISGFLNGLKSMWSNVTGWISGIGDWIKAHKGPISYDRRLLIPAGQAIMTGFAQGLNTGFDSHVETAIVRANRRLAAMPLNLSAQGNTATPAVVNTWNVEINGEVIDKDGTAKAIKRLLADYDARRS